MIPNGITYSPNSINEIIVPATPTSAGVGIPQVYKRGHKTF